MQKPKSEIMKKHIRFTICFSIAAMTSTTATAENNFCYKYDYTHPVTNVYTQGMTDADNAAIFVRGLAAATCVTT